MIKISIRNPKSISYNGMQQINDRIKYVRLPASYFYSNTFTYSKHVPQNFRKNIVLLKLFHKKFIIIEG